MNNTKVVSLKTEMADMFVTDFITKAWKQLYLKLVGGYLPNLSLSQDATQGQFWNRV